MIGRIKKRYGCGVMVIEHNMALVMSLCDEIHVLNSGRTIAIDDKTHKIYVPTASVAPTPAGGGRATYLPNTFKVVVIGK